MSMTDHAHTPTTLVTRTLSLLPTIVGALGIAATVATGVISGVTDGPQGWAATGVAALGVTVTVLSGGSYGLYAGLAILAVGGLVADGGPTRFEVTALVIALIIVHEIVRFSLDARLPSRFGPGVVLRYVGRLLGCGLILGVVSVVVQTVITSEPEGRFWLPVGLGVAALPLFVRRGAELADPWMWFRSPALRAVTGTVFVALVVTLVALAAAAKPEAQDQPTDAAVIPTTTTTTAPADDAGPAAETITVPSWAILLAGLVVAVLIYLILRRPEAIFQLEEVDRRVEDNTFDLAVAQLANAEDETVEVDEDALARLLRDLQLDISNEQDPGRAIRFGYAKIEQQLTDIGIVRTAVETEREFLLRALPTLGSAGAAMTRLTRLFEQARFGHQPVDEAMRQEALTAIDELLAVGGSTSSNHANPERDEFR
jgi:hypothetical protein